MTLGCVFLLAACTTSEPASLPTTDPPESPSTVVSQPDPPSTDGTVNTSVPATTVVEADTDLPDGRWRVVDLSGSITALEVGPAPPDGICAPFTDTYEPLLSNPDTWIELKPLPDAASWEVDGEGMLLARALETLRSDGLEITPGDYRDMVISPGPVDALFLFSFAFDNGYQSNRSLAGTNSAYQKVELGSTTTEHWGVFEAIPAAFSGGTSSLITGTFRGESAFVVQGEWHAPDRIGGSWFFNEIAIGAGCKLLSTGRGTWAAIAP